MLLKPKYSAINKLNEEIDFVLTNDSSTGLFNHGVDDIYHSTYGAKTEAEEKFVSPLNFVKNFSRKNNLKILDICFGIGYNTKSFLNEIIKNNYLNNPDNKLQIDALEYDKKLVLISPFVKDGFKNINSSYILLNCLKDEILDNKNFISQKISERENIPFLSRDIIKSAQKYDYFKGNYDPLSKYNSFLHNIYYHYISTRYKKALKASNLNNIIFNTYFDDARTTVKALDTPYDIIFLDAFTPVKLPTLWSVDFFRELYRLSANDSMLVTYSNSALVRHAMTEAGFHVGKTLDKLNKASGTIASKNIELIEHPLNEFEKGLMYTSAGVYFCDPQLNRTASEILEEHEERKNCLNLEGSSSYKKRMNRTETVYV